LIEKVHDILKAGPTDQNHIIPHATEKRIGAHATIQAICAITAIQPILPVTTKQRLCGLAGEHPVIARAAFNQAENGTRKPNRQVVTIAEIDRARNPDRSPAGR
jgi:hypothetical protein